MVICLISIHRTIKNAISQIIWIFISTIQTKRDNKPNNIHQTTKSRTQILHYNKNQRATKANKQQEHQKHQTHQTAKTTKTLLHYNKTQRATKVRR